MREEPFAIVVGLELRKVGTVVLALCPRYFLRERNENRTREDTYISLIQMRVGSSS